MKVTGGTFCHTELCKLSLSRSVVINVPKVTHGISTTHLSSKIAQNCIQPPYRIPTDHQYYVATSQPSETYGHDAASTSEGKGQSGNGKGTCVLFLPKLPILSFPSH
ncbi:hypothetical protein ACOSP7_010074 [Xanthoceras sorbifolium]